MTRTMTRQGFLTATALALLASVATTSPAQDRITLRLSTPAPATGQRAVAMAEVFAPAVTDFPEF